MIANNGKNETMKGLNKMDKNSDEWKVLDILCKVYEEHGSSQDFNRGEFMKLMLESEYNLKAGDSEVAARKLDSSNLASFSSSYIVARPRGYEYWKANK